MFAVTVSMVRASERNEHASQEVARYVRTEYGEDDPSWLVGKRENGH